ncbi:DEKNAAC103683 [Brettanomyces naardenensis]|uniref:DEKNAAC103683 n=1 Tax=Brettanomyces naardenensis TaxID=13370 RepID=A0A448YN86_BRENA|nr:DEKNAAC103683 [Brettanomyces naardenensis]
MTRSLKIDIPSYLRPARSSFELFNRYLERASEKKSKDEDDLCILAYLFGVYTVQILMQLYGQLDGDQEREECSDIIGRIVTALEQTKRKEVKKYEKKRKGNEGLVDIISDDEKGRLYLNSWCQGKMNEINQIIRKGKINGSTLEELMDVSIGLGVSKGLYSDKEDSKIEEREELPDDGKEEINEDEKKSDLGDTDNNASSADISAGLPTDHPILASLESAEDILSKPLDKGSVDANFSKEDLEAKIRWCNYHIKRILNCFKQGKDPNEDLAGLLSQPSMKEEKISSEEIDNVIEEVMRMSSDGDEKEEEDEKRGKDDDDDDDNSLKGYVYDEEEEEYVKKGEFSSQFPKAPREEKSPAKQDSKGENVPTPPLSLPQTPALPSPTPASIVAKKSSERAPVQVNQPVDLETLEKQLSNEELLHSATKCCKFAVSAIEYEDISTAIDELKESVRLLEEYQKIFDKTPT